MKKLFLTLMVVAIIIALTNYSFPQGSETSKAKSITKYETIEANYLEGLNSDNLGLKISSAYFLGEMKSNKSVIPLMTILQKETDEGLRIMAAWSLIKIGDPRGVYHVKLASENCNCKSVKSISEYLYNHFLLANNGGINFILQSK